MDCESSLVFFAVNAVFGMLTTRSPARKSKTNQFIHYPSDRSLASIPVCTFMLSDLRNVSCNNPGRLLLKVLSSKQCTRAATLLWFVLAAYGVTSQYKC